MSDNSTHEELKRPEDERREQPRGASGAHGGQGHQMQGMEHMAAQVTRHYDAPAPHSQWPTPEPFPRAVMRGLGQGAGLGAVLGLIAGYLLANNSVVVPGWELMYSGAPATIYTLWAFLGVALGVATLGVGAILAARAEPAHRREAPQPRAKLPESATARERERSVGEGDRAPR